MIELNGDLWQQQPYFEAVVVTTNGQVDSQGAAIMGGGCALEAAQRYRDLPFLLGHRLQKFGNACYVFYLGRHTIVTMPTKGDVRKPSNLNLIIRSLGELQDLTNQRGWKKVLLPRPGVGLGGLDWETQVRPLCRILDNRFHIITYDLV